MLIPARTVTVLQTYTHSVHIVRWIVWTFRNPIRKTLCCTCATYVKLKFAPKGGRVQIAITVINHSFMFVLYYWFVMVVAAVVVVVDDIKRRYITQATREDDELREPPQSRGNRSKLLRRGNVGVKQLALRIDFKNLETTFHRVAYWVEKEKNTRGRKTLAVRMYRYVVM